MTQERPLYLRTTRQLSVAGVLVEGKLPGKVAEVVLQADYTTLRLDLKNSTNWMFDPTQAARPYAGHE